MRRYAISAALLIAFEAIAIALWLAKGNVFYVLNFSYIGISMSLEPYCSFGAAGTPDAYVREACVAHTERTMGVQPLRRPAPATPKLKCNWSGKLCDIPCMSNVMDNPTGVLHPCRWPRKAKGPAVYPDKSSLTS